MDLVVIVRVRQRFGSSDDQTGIEQNAPFVGTSKQYEFACPDVDSSSESVLLFQAQHVLSGQSRVSINGVNIAGGVPEGGFDTVTDVTDSITAEPDGSIVVGSVDETVAVVGLWSAQTLIVPPNTLATAGNVLEIEARTATGATSGDIPNFIVDNVSLFFRTAGRRIGPPVASTFESR